MKKFLLLGCPLSPGTTQILPLSQTDNNLIFKYLLDSLPPDGEKVGETELFDHNITKMLQK